jgi:anti-sigma regulatory factor (Ser/Thr protein kinase)
VSGATSDIRGQGFELRLTGGPTAGLEARRAVLAGDGSVPASMRGDLLLLVTELVTNAVRHGPVGPDRSLLVAVQWGPGGVQVEVGDPGGGPKLVHPRPRHDGSGGWGLVLVDRIADRWGVTRTPGGTSVWFEIEANR